MCNEIHSAQVGLPISGERWVQLHVSSSYGYKGPQSQELETLEANQGCNPDVEHLPSTHKVLDPVSSTAKEN